VHSGDLAGGFSDLEMTWLLYCAGAATGASVTCVLTNLFSLTYDVDRFVAVCRLYENSACLQLCIVMSAKN